MNTDIVCVLFCTFLGISVSSHDIPDKNILQSVQNVYIYIYMQFKPYTYRDHCIANVYTCIAFTSDTIYKYYEIVFPSDLLLNKLFIIIFSNGISMGCELFTIYSGLWWVFW